MEWLNLRNIFHKCPISWMFILYLTHVQNTDKQLMFWLTHSIPDTNLSPFVSSQDQHFISNWSKGQWEYPVLSHFSNLRITEFQWAQLRIITTTLITCEDWEASVTQALPNFLSPGRWWILSKNITTVMYTNNAHYNSIDSWGTCDMHGICKTSIVWQLYCNQYE